MSTGDGATGRHGTARRARRRPTLATLVTGIVVSGMLGGCAGSPGQAAPPPSRSRTHAPPAPAGTSGWTLIATAKGTIDDYASPGGARTGTIPATWQGGPSSLPVVNQRSGWLEVRLATRPNQSTAWVPEANVTLTSTPYRILVDLTTRHVELTRLGHVLVDAPAGIGTPTDPTPTGQYFLALFAQPPSSGYGPFVMVTSAHSDAITDWQGSGDALIAIHGPLGAGAEIGTTGAAISHGCIRLHLADLARFRQVPAGTPITITRGAVPRHV